MVKFYYEQYLTKKYIYRHPDFFERAMMPNVQPEPFFNFNMQHPGLYAEPEIQADDSSSSSSESAESASEEHSSSSEESEEAEEIDEPNNMQTNMTGKH